MLPQLVPRTFATEGVTCTQIQKQERAQYVWGATEDQTEPNSVDISPPARMAWKLTKDTHAPEGSPGQMLGWLELKALTSQVTPKTWTFLNKQMWKVKEIARSLDSGCWFWLHRLLALWFWPSDFTFSCLWKTQFFYYLRVNRKMVKLAWDGILVLLRMALISGSEEATEGE